MSASTGTDAVAAVKAGLTHLSVRRSVSVVFPKHDGYRDSVRFLVSGTTTTGSAAAVTGRAVLSRGAAVVKTWKLTRSTQVLVWNGRTHQRLKTGSYGLRVVEHAANGTVTRASSSVRVSAAALVKRTRSLATSLTAKTVHNRMPAAVRRAFAVGTVSVQVTTVVERLAGHARLAFLNGRHVSYQPLHRGVNSTPKLSVPNTAAFRSVTFRHDWKRGSLTLKSLKVVWTYDVLE